MLGGIEMSKIESGLYRHFKGTVYEVICCAKHSETLEDMVVYRQEDDAQKVWVRPAHMWNENVERGGETFKRFTRIGDTE